jgi:hypothetical protein
MDKEIVNTIDRVPKAINKIIKAISNDLSDRSGIGDEFDAIDDETKDEMKKEWYKIIYKILMQEEILGKLTIK